MQIENDGTRQSLLEACQIVLQRMVEIREADCQSPMVQAAIRDAAHYLEQAYESLENMEAKTAPGPRVDFANSFNSVSDQIDAPDEPASVTRTGVSGNGEDPEEKVLIRPIDPIGPRSFLPDPPPALRLAVSAPPVEPTAGSPVAPPHRGTPVELSEDTDRRINLNVTHLMLESARLHDEAGAPPGTTFR